ncbi:hypothetical protein PYW07_010957 [Mythimna separata]|uniref:Uncharacterized protein n=1 Tax=Mythimna separata TaxID=271217 RepID=A0AAD7Y836_MYTSE|nr:hypothetical protein PYW07_010957 [Mythimna separata]
MKTSLLIVILHIICAIKCANITIGAEIEVNDKLPRLQDLEKQKTEIYNRLNEAINDTINTLNKSNDIDARQGVTYMQELMALIDSFNGTELAQAHTVCNGTDCTNETTVLKTPSIVNITKDGRRRDKDGNPKISGFDHIKQAIIKTGALKKKEDVDQKKEEKVQNLIVLQAKLDKWLKIREIEKQKIKQYRLRQISHRHQTITEECPNYGDKKKKAGLLLFGNSVELCKCYIQYGAALWSILSPVVMYPSVAQLALASTPTALKLVSHLGGYS